MQIEQITQKYYLFMVVDIPTTDTTPTWRMAGFFQTFFTYWGPPLLLSKNASPALKKLISSPLTCFNLPLVTWINIGKDEYELEFSSQLESLLLRVLTQAYPRDN